MDPKRRINESNPTGITVRRREVIERAHTLAKQDWLCKSCVHYKGDMTCKAFPYGIPLEISAGDYLHLKLIGIEDEPVAFEEALRPSTEDL